MMNINQTEIKIVMGNIADLPIDGIVHLTSGKITGMQTANGGLFTAAGPELFKACLRLGDLQPGTVGITLGYNLPVKFVIHAIGPQYGKEQGYEASYLEDCYNNSLELAGQKHLTTLAFPVFSGGAYSYPVAEAASIALETVQEYLQSHPQTSIKEIIFVSPGNNEFEVYKDTAAEIFG